MQRHVGLGLNVQKFSQYPNWENLNFRPVPGTHPTTPILMVMCASDEWSINVDQKIWWDSIMRAEQRIIVLEMVLIRKGGKY